jgi:hypothetical protein
VEWYEESWKLRLSDEQTEDLPQKRRPSIVPRSKSRWLLSTLMFTKRRRCAADRFR